MTLTRCPACQTVFRVRPEQLAARAGLVRCGHCFDAFNAREHLLDEAPAETGPSPASSPPPDVAADEPFFVLEERSPQPPSVDLDFEFPDSLLPRAARERHPGRFSETRIEPRDTAAEDELDFVAPPPPKPQIAPPPDTTEDAAPGPAVEPEFELAAQPDSEPEAPPDEPRIEAAAPVERDGEEPFAIGSAAEPEEIFSAVESDSEALDRHYGRPPPERKSRWLAGLVAGLLLGTLAAQSIYLFRGEIARDWPALRPALVAACAPLNCVVPLPQVAAALSVEASDLQAEPGRPGHYTLHATLRNRAPHPQAFPHLELTLLDGREQALARKVFTPQEWTPDANHGEGFAAASELAVVLPLEAANVSPAGYRIYVFYP